MKLILAGTFQEYKKYLIKHGLNEQTAVFIDDVNKARGLSPHEILTTGTFWDRPDAREIYKMALNRL